MIENAFPQTVPYSDVMVSIIRIGCTYLCCLCMTLVGENPTFNEYASK